MGQGEVGRFTQRLCLSEKPLARVRVTVSLALGVN